MFLNVSNIPRISYCMADPTWDHVFSFISETEAGAGQLECHAFLCPKRKMAKVRPQPRVDSSSCYN